MSLLSCECSKLKRESSAFLSTLSLRRATTSSINVSASGSTFLSTLSLRRATCWHFAGVQQNCISIHALLAESDIGQLQCIPGRKYFYPRSPCGERRLIVTVKRLYLKFLSTLSLRRATGVAGSGKRSTSFLSTLSLRRATRQMYISTKILEHFYPRSPCGERLANNLNMSSSVGFLSTLSLRRATVSAPNRPKE